MANWSLGMHAVRGAQAARYMAIRVSSLVTHVYYATVRVGMFPWLTSIW